MTPDDHLALLGMAARYAAAIDSRDLSGAAALFAPDAVLVLPDPARDHSPVLEHSGLDAITAALSQVLSVELTVHEIVGQVVEPGPTSEQAHGHVRCVAHHVNGEQDVVWHLRYADTYVLLPDGWRIARRALHIDLVEIQRVRPRASTPTKESS